ncbi:unnamed protein product [Camellia sinensis]
MRIRGGTQGIKKKFSHGRLKVVKHRSKVSGVSLISFCQANLLCLTTSFQTVIVKALFWLWDLIPQHVFYFVLRRVLDFSFYIYIEYGLVLMSVLVYIYIYI